ncbi:Uncharacterised protein [Klebsiella quasipneumoniae]|nr:Uncharacterised protein [Klebsiella quasipneumoniae]
MKRMQRFLRLASLLCLLTACATMQLAHMKQLQSTRQYEAIIAETPVASCNDPSQSREVCRQFYAIRGHAYLKLAMNESQPGAHCPHANPISTGQYRQCGARLCACVFCRRQGQ